MKIKYSYLSEFHRNSLYIYHFPNGISFRDTYCTDRSYCQLVQLFLWNVDNHTRLHWLFDMTIIAFNFLSNINKLHLKDFYFCRFLIIMRIIYFYFLRFPLCFYQQYGKYIVTYWLTTCKCHKKSLKIPKG
jgi:hypothetical protein